MIRLRFFLRYALNRLRHGGQRVLIAVLAVAFGVMSLIAMTSIADAVEAIVTVPEDIQLGGDVRIRRDGRTFGADELGLLDTLKADGLITAYSPVSEDYMLMMRTERSGEARFVRNMTAIDPNVYPLAGELRLADGLTLAEAFTRAGDAVITRDLAKDYGINVGDTLRFAYPDGQSLPAPLTVTGIIDRTPSRSGQSIYYDFETFSRLYGKPAAYDYVSITTPDAPALVARLEADGWSARAISGSVDQSPERDLFNLMLRGAGVLGLIVGGIGIANTMNVLLAQRRQEVGILKTIGYSGRNMLTLFLLEAVILGAVGSILGALAAVLISQGITQLFANISTMLIDTTFNPLLSLSGILIGVGTTVLFALQAIIRASRIRPTVIFRQETVTTGGWRSRFETLAFYALLSIPFAGITTLVMGSPVDGVGILLFALGGLIGFGIVLSIAAWVMLRVIPAARFNLLRMARNNMRKRAGSMLFAMIALTVGIFTMGFALTIVQIGLDQFGMRQNSGEGPALMVYTDAQAIPPIESLLAEKAITETQRSYILSGVRYRLGDHYEFGGAELHARDEMWDVDIIEGPPLTPAVAGVYLPKSWPAAIGDTLEISLSDGTTRDLPVIGIFAARPPTALSPLQDYPIVSTNTLQSLGTPRIHLYVYSDNPAQLSQELGAAFPAAMTLTGEGITQEIHRIFINLLGFALAMSGLALLAGVMLSANVVSLAMIERRPEIGVMKAVGYTQRHILTVIALEYGLIGLIAAVVGLVGVQVMVTLLTLTQSAALGLMFVHPLTALIIIAAGVALTVITAVASAWEPTQVRPLAILNARAS